jgi:membrane associated rhomboid family serine protease
MKSDSEFVLAELARHRRRALPLRIVLAVAASAQLVLSLIWLAGFTPISANVVTDDHLARDGALGIVFGVVGLAAAKRPQFAWFSLPVLVVLLVVQSVFLFVDVRTDEVTHGFEWMHLLGAVVAICVAWLVRPTGRRTKRAQGLHEVGRS